MSWNGSSAAPPLRLGWCAAPASCCWPPTGWRCGRLRPPSGSSGALCATGLTASATTASRGSLIAPGWAVPGAFPPAVELHTTHLACTLPDAAGRPLSQWDSTELARQLVADGIVPAISASTVRRILARQRLRPWRAHYWLHPRRPRDAAFLAQVRGIADLYTRPLAPGEHVLCFDELTALAPRPRKAPTRPAQSGRPRQVEHESGRSGALNVLAAIDTRDGSVSAYLCRRKRAAEVCRFLDLLDEQLPEAVTRVHLVCDNVTTHRGTKVRTWLAAHPRWTIHHPPVHCSWMNQIEQWFSILSRKRLRLPNFSDLDALADALRAWIADWNAHAHPFAWTTASFAKLIAKVEVSLSQSTAPPEAA